MSLTSSSSTIGSKQAGNAAGNSTQATSSSLSTEPVPPPVALVLPPSPLQSPISTGSVFVGTDDEVKKRASNDDDDADNTASKPRSSAIQICVRMRPLLSRNTKSVARNSLAAPSSSSLREKVGRPSFASPTRSSLATATSDSSSSSEVLSDYAWEAHSSTNTIRQATWTRPDAARKSSYTFDRVFGPSSATASLYDSSVRHIVRSAVDGYHGSVFAYGQTSTGKTHTMMGTTDEPGVVPLAVEDVFRYIKSDDASRVRNREFLLRVSYMEIYNEQIYDLFAPPTSLGTKSSSQIRIFESRNEGVIIRGLREDIVTSPKDVFKLIKIGDANRHTGATHCNKNSSRSHSVFRLLIESRVMNYNERDYAADAEMNFEDLNKPIRISSLSLIDLAGSESAKATKTNGIRQMEGQFINKSLSTLGQVIYKLSELAESKTPTKDNVKTKHIPFRESKLTRILQTSLSGNAQVCIICNISPSLRNIEETYNTLKFASRAKKITQAATIKETVDDKTLLKNYKEEIYSLRRQLQEAQEAHKAAMQRLESQKPNGDVEETNDVEETKARIEDDFGEESQLLVSAIKNLQKLILSAEPASKTKLVGTGDDDDDDVDEDEEDDEEDLLSVESPSSDERPPPTKDFPTPHQLFGREDGGTSTMVTPVNSQVRRSSSGRLRASSSKDLFQELHRIQNLLDSVLTKKRRPPQSAPPKSLSSSRSDLSAETTTTTTTTMHPPAEPGESPMQAPTTPGPDRDREIAMLRSELVKQDMVVCLRQADSSFLESQLAQKDQLLKDVSKVLTNVEQRQVELEVENRKMRDSLRQKDEIIASKNKELHRYRLKMEEEKELFLNLVE